MATADEKAAETQGRAIDGQIMKLEAEKALLLRAPIRIPEIDAEIAILARDLANIQSRRPPRPAAITRGDLNDTRPG